MVGGLAGKRPFVVELERHAGSAAEAQAAKEEAAVAAAAAKKTEE